MSLPACTRHSVPMFIDKSSFTVTKLYRDSLRLADYISSRSGISNHRVALWEQIRQSFRKNASETDPDKIQEHKDAAIRGLSNYMFHEAQRMAKEEVQEGNDKFDG